MRTLSRGQHLGTFPAISRFLAGMQGWGTGMATELVFYVLTASLFALGMWSAVNLLF
jgi:hypothetical protein